MHSMGLSYGLFYGFILWVILWVDSMGLFYGFILWVYSMKKKKKRRKCIFNARSRISVIKAGDSGGPPSR